MCLKETTRVGGSVCAAGALQRTYDLLGLAAWAVDGERLPPATETDPRGGRAGLADVYGDLREVRRGLEAESAGVGHTTVHDALRLLQADPQRRAVERPGSNRVRRRPVILRPSPVGRR